MCCERETRFGVFFGQVCDSCYTSFLSLSVPFSLSLGDQRSSPIHCTSFSSLSFTKPPFTKPPPPPLDPQYKNAKKTNSMMIDHFSKFANMLPAISAPSRDL